MSDDIAACPHSLAERETAVADGMCPICSADALSRLTTPPPDEIAGLIDHAKQYFHIITRKEMAGEFPQIGLPAYIEKMASALRALAQENERLKTQAPPTEIAGLIDKLEYNPPPVLGDRTLQTDAAEALRALAQENAGLKTIAYERWEIANERIRELEAERDEAKADYLRRHKDVGDQMDRRIKAEAERDAVQANLEQTSKWLQGAHLEMGRIRAKTIEECKDAVTQVVGDGGDAVDAMQAIRALAQTDERKG